MKTYVKSIRAIKFKYIRRSNQMPTYFLREIEFMQSACDHERAKVYSVVKEDF